MIEQKYLELIHNFNNFNAYTNLTDYSIVPCLIYMLYNKFLFYQEHFILSPLQL